MFTDQEKQNLKQQITSNQHEIFVISLEEMDAIVRSSPKSNMPGIQDMWQKLKSKAEVGTSYYASVDDLRTLSKLLGDLGGFTTKAYVKSYKGRPHIILKGHPGLRNILTGTKYGIQNPKVITMGLGKSGAVHAAKSGGILSIVLISAYRVVDYFLTDGATLTQLVGSLATDIVKVGLATGASIAAASAVVAMGFTVAIGPIAAVVLVGVGTSMALSALDEHYGITDRVIAGLDSMSENIENRIEHVKQGLYQQAGEVVDSIFDYAIDSAKTILINTVRHSLDKFLSQRPRLY
ncbi:hypothetical protein G8770_22615 [Aestuariicella hydrocarbonica]|uniref:Uncharacterized protein n=1 Tax=Pseudomaricurvus hydrocarbonicus TaxID=1470433 RepID=A0A9E5T2E4_9GAMM|nr:hypothetical protein [Aestuariicella hydrocarbonica]NHO68355.1 hypothetical protein [Aestuariicella hydrocarbonica]